MGGRAGSDTAAPAVFLISTMKYLHKISDYAGLTECISEVRALRSERQCHVVGLPYVFLNKVTMVEGERELKCCYKKSYEEERMFDHNRLDLANGFGFRFVYDRKVYSVDESDWLIRRSIPLGNFSDNEPWNLEWHIYKFHRGHFPAISDNEKRYFRYVSPLTRKFDFFRDFEFCNKDIGLWSWTLESMKVSVTGVEFSFYKVTVDEYSYLVIDNLAPTSRKVYDESVTSILFAVGFIEQNIHLDESYTFVIDNPRSGRTSSMEYMSLRESIVGQYDIFTTNAYSVRLPIENKYGFDGYGDVDEWSNKLRQCPKTVIDNLASLTYKYPIIANCIAILVDGTKAGLEIQGASFAVALEALANLIEKENLAPVGKVKPVVDKSKWKKLRKVYLKLLEDAGLTAAEKEFISRKLNSLNQIPNKDRLQAPFAALGVALSQVELDTIEMRNNFLHGRNECDLTPQSMNQMVWTCKLLHQLCCILLFKLCGFSGHIIDQTAFDGTNSSVVSPATGFRLI